MRWKKRPNKKKATIFKIFLIPLLVITIGTLVVRRTAGMLEAYSSGMMSRLVENRAVILQNEMNQRWVSVREDEEILGGILAEILEEEEIPLRTFMESDEMSGRFLEAAAE